VHSRRAASVPEFARPPPIGAASSLPPFAFFLYFHDGSAIALDRLLSSVNVHEIYDRHWISVGQNYVQWARMRMLAYPSAKRYVSLLVTSGLSLSLSSSSLLHTRDGIAGIAVLRVMRHTREREKRIRD